MKIFNLQEKKIVPDGCMITFCGAIVDLMNPKSSDILIQDIAHGLAFNCRWNGATKSYFSIAEHCCMMYDRAPFWLKKTALFHDAEEAYWGDIIKPLKNILPQEIRNKMREMRAIIYDKFSIPDHKEDIQELDFELLIWDFDNLIRTKQHEGWLPEQAEREWFKRAAEL